MPLSIMMHPGVRCRLGIHMLTDGSGIMIFMSSVDSMIPRVNVTADLQCRPGRPCSRRTGERPNAGTVSCNGSFDLETLNVPRWRCPR